VTLRCSGWLTASDRRARHRFGYLVPVVLVWVAWTGLAIAPSAVPTALAAPPTQCSDRKDNDGDGKIDLADPGCVNSADNDETDPPPPPPPPAAQCADGIDNDGDGKIDLADPGCVNSTTDNDETDPPPPVFVSVPATPAATPSGPRFLSPFPIVRVRGRLRQHGVTIDLLSVRAPRGSRIEVRCRGRGCPRRRQVRRARRRAMRFRAFERTLRAGVVLEVFVTRSGRIGKYVSFKIRAGRPPLRRDRCVMPGKRVPRACPAT
jgi:hypothetical protein